MYVDAEKNTEHFASPPPLNFGGHFSLHINVLITNLNLCQDKCLRQKPLHCFVMILQLLQNTQRTPVV